MKFSGTTIALLTTTIASSKNAAEAASDSWNGKMPINYYVGASDCTGNATYSGYASGVIAIGDGNICETDHFDMGNGSFVSYYTKWVTLCGSQGPLPSAMYQFSLPCTDSSCSNCSDIPDAAAQIPWSYFDPDPLRCMTVNTFNASTTDPAKEFASGDFLSLLGPSSESFGGSDEDFNGYWDVFLANSCMGPEPITPSPTPGEKTPLPPSSAHYVAEGIEVVLFVGLVSSSLFIFFI
ncbi:hypothetical protein ACHAWT_002136 [Skeletonema menzelii]|mmetsp:Transcript_17846/g.29220  ORF Transcript_17846/g.29220 Transcript_17846/m.29220 type:complete len:237 (+) Transcript_17846:33-743(+)|eukprot:scaffold5409_cov142-Skeletonema_menzelii.AAC.7